MAKNRAKEKEQEMGEERMAALDGAVKQLVKRFGEGTLMRLGEASHLRVAAIPTG